MATSYRFALAGVGSNVQYGRRGGYVDWNTGTSTFRFFDNDASTPVNVRVAQTPVDDNDAASKFYVDSLVQSLAPKDSVRVATTAAGTLASDFENGDTVDGIVLATNDRILIKDQAAPADNGIYVVQATGAPVRATDADAAGDIASAFVFVEEGTVNASRGFVTTFKSTDTLGTTAMNWTQFSGAGTYSGSNGVQLVGSDFQLDISGLSSATPVVTTDSVVFYDASGTTHLARTFADIINDLSITLDSDLTGGIGIDVTGTTFSFNNSGMADTAVQAADTVPFFDSSNVNEPEFRSFANILADLDIVTATADGIVARTAADTYASRTLTADGAGSLDGLAITNGDGVAGNPTIGLDIQNLPARTDAADNADRIPVWNSTATANEYYLLSDILGATSAFTTVAGAGNTTGDASLVSDTSTDTLTVTGGDGINIDVTAATDTLTFSLSTSGLADTATATGDLIPFFDVSNSNAPEMRSLANIITDQGVVTTGNIATSLTAGIGIDITASTVTFDNSGMADTAVVGTDTVPFFDTSNGSEAEFRSFTNILADLDIVTAAADGMLVRTAADTYASRTLTASATASEEGIVITNGDGVAANPTIGLEINGLTANTAVAGTTEFVLYDGTNNRKVTAATTSDEFTKLTNTLRVIESSIGIVDGAVLGQLPDQARIARIRVVVDTPYDASADINIVINAAARMDENEVAADIAGIFETDVDYRNSSGSDQAITLDLINGTPTVGAGRVYVEYYAGSTL